MQITIGVDGFFQSVDTCGSLDTLSELEELVRSWRAHLGNKLLEYRVELRDEICVKNSEEKMQLRVP